MLLYMVCGVASSSPPPPPVNPHEMSLYKMNDFARTTGAVCLDGSPGAFYYRPATNETYKDDWVLHFKGAGWCYDEKDCLERSKMEFGSSTSWANTSGGWSSGILNPNDETFGHFNKVVLLYCDGASFTGDRTDPLIVTGTHESLYFRGRRIRDAIMATLARDHGFQNARNVLLTGCSSGGLAAYIHTDWMEKEVRRLARRTLQNFKVLPGSGFFAHHDNVDGVAVYVDEIENVFKLSNSTGGLSPKCLAAHPAAPHLCMFAEHAYAASSAPTFVENSALDAWQTDCILTAAPLTGFPNTSSGKNGNCSNSDGGSWKACASLGANPNNCTHAQMSTMNAYLRDFVAVLNATRRFHERGNGAFLHSCHTHCEALSGGWLNFKIDGVAMRDAGRAWWKSNGSDPAATHTYLPCAWHNAASGVPHQCNPTCTNYE